MNGSLKSTKDKWKVFHGCRDLRLQQINWMLEINAPAGKSEQVFDNF